MEIPLQHTLQYLHLGPAVSFQPTSLVLEQHLGGTRVGRRQGTARSDRRPLQQAHAAAGQRLDPLLLPQAALLPQGCRMLGPGHVPALQDLPGVSGCKDAAGGLLQQKGPSVSTTPVPIASPRAVWVAHVHQQPLLTSANTATPRGS